jgi:hypothetical protein
MVNKEAKGTNSVPKKKKMSAREREELLIENFIGLQKAMTHLSMKFENLSDNIGKLLNVFELSAKDFIMNKGKANPETDKDLLNKINSLLEQNKTIAKGLVMIEEKVRNKGEVSQEQVQQQPQFQPRPLPQFPPQQQPKRIIDQI